MKWTPLPGAATLVYNFPSCEQVVGLTVQAPAAGTTRPTKRVICKAIFENGSLSGTVTFDSPLHHLLGRNGKRNL